MTTQKTLFSAHKASDRIQSLDIMRGFVLLGILLMNINGMGLAGAYGDPTVSGGSTGWNLATWICPKSCKTFICIAICRRFSYNVIPK